MGAVCVLNGRQLQETQAELEAVRTRATAAEEELAALKAASGDMDRLRQKASAAAFLSAFVRWVSVASPHAILSLVE